MEGGIAALGLHLAELEGGEVDTLQVDDVDGAVLELGIFHMADGIHLQVEAQQFDGLLHNGSVASNNGATLLVSLFAV